MYNSIVILLIVSICHDAYSGRNRNDDRIYFPNTHELGNRYKPDTNSINNQNTRQNTPTLTTEQNTPVGQGDRNILIDRSPTRSFEIPLDLAKQLNSIDNVTEFLDKFVDPDSIHAYQIQSRFGDSNSERSNAQKPIRAACIPEMQIVRLESTKNESNLMLHPECIRVERCGGCCSNSLLECQPTSTETVNMQTLVLKYTVGDSSFKYLGWDIIPVEKHLKCTCGCRIKKQDCNEVQDYDENSCKCNCINKDEERKCYRRNDTKFWDDNTCTCRCKSVSECTTGYSFDKEECKCKQATVKRRFAELSDDDIKRIQQERKRLKLMPIPVVPEEENDEKKEFVDSDESE